MMAGRKMTGPPRPDKRQKDKKMTEERKNEIIEKLEKLPARSAWRRGVKGYAVDMVNDLYLEGVNIDAINRADLEKELLNGAKNWKEYSWGGCALCYDEQIARALCTPSELKKTRNGERRPNAREEWLDVQARALYQAFIMINYARQTAGPRG